MTRREAIALAAAPALAAPDEPAPIDPAAVARHDANVERLMKGQVTDRASRYYGAFPDAFGIHAPGVAGGLIHAFALALMYKDSRYYRNAEVAERLRAAAEFLRRSQNERGNIYLPTTNFDSPPDTAFTVLGVATAALIARQFGRRDISALLEPFLLKAGGALAVGGVHTPNHRWVVCQALAQINELYPDPRYVRRIDQWLAETIDIDEDGQYNERSTLVYNVITNRALIVTAHKLKRWELLEPVRRNLESMLYLIHPGNEVVTEISRRQDRNTRGDLAGYWFPLQYMAIRDQDGRFASLARQYVQRAALGELLEYPELRKPLPPSAPLPENYEKEMRAIGVTRIRRGLSSATLHHAEASAFFSVRRGAAVVNAVRFASAFFGKGQFRPQTYERRGGVRVLTQTLEGPYYQPLDPPRPVPAHEFDKVRPERRRTEICRLTQTATITETANGFTLRIEAAGTDNVPVSVEINLREGGSLEGAELVSNDVYVLPTGATATFRSGADQIRIGPGLKEHTYTAVRGAEAKLGGPSLYLTGTTPFTHTLQFVLG